MKKLLLITLSLCLCLCAGAQQNAHRPKNGGGAKNITFSQSDVQYWVGTGSNSCVLVVGWDDAGTALAWGYRWNGSKLVADMLQDIDNADSRLSIRHGGMVGGFTYVDDTYNLQPDADWWCYTINGVWAAGVQSQLIADGDMVEFSDDCSFSLTSAVAVPDPNGSNPSDPEEATIAASDILYWVGAGENEAILAINWVDTCLAWGYRYSGNSVSVSDMLVAIDQADSRLAITGATSFVSEITFNDSNLHFATSSGSYWMFNVNGETAQDYAPSIYLSDGDFVKFGDLACGTGIGEPAWGFYPAYVWEQTVYPVSAPGEVEPGDPEDATIAFDAIRYWVGQGENQAVVAVNWAQPDTCLAWGVRFNGSITLKDAMDSIQASDPRFEYGAAYGFVNDITFEAGDDILALSEGAGNYWASLLNGEVAQSLFGELVLRDGDFAKWGDMNAATVLTWDTTEYGIYAGAVVFTTLVVPVTEPNLMGQGPYDGPAGTEGSLAIEATANCFMQWATTCELNLGPQNLSQEGSPLVSYGSADDAIGAVEMGNNLGVVSLGDGGWATLTFDGYITNGEGPDFAVFENSFDDYFLELAFVEVSSDGERFVRFPAVSLTQTQTQVLGNGMLDATNLYNLAGKYRSGYGVGFDLEELRDSTGLDINNVTHVRIVDVVGSIDPQYGTRDSQGNMVNDPFPTNSYSSGFDLDGVGVIHFSTTRTESIEEISEFSNQISVFPNPATDYVRIQNSDSRIQSVELYDMQGRCVRSLWNLNSEICALDLKGLPKGIYMVRAGEQTSKLIVK